MSKSLTKKQRQNHEEQAKVAIHVKSIKYNLEISTTSHNKVQEVQTVIHEAKNTQKKSISVTNYLLTGKCGDMTACTWNFFVRQALLTILLYGLVAYFCDDVTMCRLFQTFTKKKDFGTCKSCLEQLLGMLWDATFACWPVKITDCLGITAVKPKTLPIPEVVKQLECFVAAEHPEFYQGLLDSMAWIQGYISILWMQCYCSVALQLLDLFGKPFELANLKKLSDLNASPFSNEKITWCYDQVVAYYPTIKSFFGMIAFFATLWYGFKFIKVYVFVVILGYLFCCPLYRVLGQLTFKWDQQVVVLADVCKLIANVLQTADNLIAMDSLSPKKQKQLIVYVYEAWTNGDKQPLNNWFEEVLQPNSLKDPSQKPAYLALQFVLHDNKSCNSEHIVQSALAKHQRKHKLLQFVCICLVSYAFYMYLTLLSHFYWEGRSESMVATADLQFNTQVEPIAFIEHVCMLCTLLTWVCFAALVEFWFTRLL